jgi:hypothetical protein
MLMSEYMEIDITTKDCENLIDGEVFTWQYKTKEGTAVNLRIFNPDTKRRGKDFPKLSDLRGIEPNLTGGLSPEEFVRKMRDEEWE